MFTDIINTITNGIPGTLL